MKIQPIAVYIYISRDLINKHKVNFPKKNYANTQNKAPSEHRKELEVSNLGNFNKLILVIMSIEKGFLAEYLHPKLDYIIIVSNKSFYLTNKIR